MSAPAGKVLLDGRPVSAGEAVIPVHDPGLLRGDGVFEVVRLYRGRPFAADEHFDRMERSAAGLMLPLERELVERDFATMVEALAGADCMVRVLVTRDGRRVVLEEPLLEYPPRLRLVVVEHLPSPLMAGIKSLSYAGNMLAGRIAKEKGFDDALLVTPGGVVLEAPVSSFFWVAGAMLLTPPLTAGVLGSITRQALLDLGLAEERDCLIGELAEAEEACLVGTSLEAHPVGSIDGVRDFPEEQPAVAGAAAELRSHIDSRVSG